MHKRLLSLLLVAISFQVHAQPFELDPTFDNDGIKPVTNHPRSNFIDVAVQTDGRLVCGGTIVINDTLRALLSRYWPDGKADSSFGVNGSVITTGTVADMRLSSVKLLPGNKILALGTQHNIVGENNPEYFLLQYTAAGLPDSSFSGSGKIVHGYPPQTDAQSGKITVQANGKIIVSSNFNSTCLEFMASRHNADGSADSSFGTNGVVIVSPEASCQNNSYCSAIQSDGKIILCGSTQTFSQDLGELAFIRLNINGTIDSSFGNNGIALINVSNISEQANRVIILPGDKILACGAANSNSYLSEKAFVVQLNADGSRDNSFGNNGVAGQLLNSSQRTIFTGMAVDIDGRIICSGYIYLNGVSMPLLAKYQANGTSDYSFGVNGMIITIVPGSNTVYSEAMALFNNRIYLAGVDFFNDNEYATVLAYRAINSTVPLTLVQFYGTLQNNNSLLYWKASTENNSHYVIEKSLDGIHFKNIATIAAGSGNYHFTDTASAGTERFYRLQMVQTGGNFKYSTVVHFPGMATSAGISIFPNPVRDVLNIMFHRPHNYSTVQIADAGGRIVKTIENGYNGNNTAAIDVHFLKPGIYYLLVHHKGTMLQQQFFKQ